MLVNILKVGYMFWRQSPAIHWEHTRITTRNRDSDQHPWATRANWSQKRNFWCHWQGYQLVDRTNTDKLQPQKEHTPKLVRKKQAPRLEISDDTDCSFGWGRISWLKNRTLSRILRERLRSFKGLKSRCLLRFSFASKNHFWQTQWVLHFTAEKKEVLGVKTMVASMQQDVHLTIPKSAQSLLCTHMFMLSCCFLREPKKRERETDRDIRETQRHRDRENYPSCPISAQQAIYTHLHTRTHAQHTHTHTCTIQCFARNRFRIQGSEICSCVWIVVPLESLPCSKSYLLCIPSTTLCSDETVENTLERLCLSKPYMPQSLQR